MTDFEHLLIIVLFGSITAVFVLLFWASVKNKNRRAESARILADDMRKTPLEALTNIGLLIATPVFFGWLFLSSIGAVELGAPFMVLVIIMFGLFILMFLTPSR